MEVEDSRVVLERLAAARGVDLSALSRLIGRNPAYVQQFIRRGSPRQLAEEDRRALAQFFEVDEALLGAPPSPPPGEHDLVRVPRLAVDAAAGAGALPTSERDSGGIGFSARWLRETARGARDRLAVIQVIGDSMQPTLRPGDEILVDRADAAEGLRDGIYVLRADGGLVVKRLAVDRAARRIAIISDNPDYPRWPDRDLAGVDIVARVLWVGRRLG